MGTVAPSNSLLESQRREIKAFNLRCTAPARTSCPFRSSRRRMATVSTARHEALLEFSNLGNADHLPTGCYVFPTTDLREFDERLAPLTAIWTAGRCRRASH